MKKKQTNQKIKLSNLELHSIEDCMKLSNATKKSYKRKANVIELEKYREKKSEV